MMAEDAIIIIRSIVMSEKGGMPIKNLSREYSNECGEPIPYKKYGHSNLQSFLKSIDGIVIGSDHNGDITLQVRANEKTAHIKNLVSEQKSVSKKKKKRPKSAPGRSTGVSDRNYNVVKKSASIKNHYKSTANLNSSPAKAKVSKPYIGSLPTTRESKKDVRGLPFVVMEPKSTNLKTDVRGIPFVVLTEKNSEETNKENKKMNSESEVFKKNDLKITIKNNCERRVEVENPKVRFVLKKEECSACECPLVNGYTLFGDDFFFDFASKYLDYPVSSTSQSIGMCKPDITILDASKLFHARHHFPKKILICLGSIDLIAGRNFEEIAYDYYSLVNDVTSLVQKVAVCTIPPLLKVTKRTSGNLLRTNQLIKCVPEDMDKHVKVIDLYEEISINAEVKLNINSLYNYSHNHLPITLNEKGHYVLENILDEYL